MRDSWQGKSRRCFVCLGIALIGLGWSLDSTYGKVLSKDEIGQLQKTLAARSNVSALFTQRNISALSERRGIGKGKSRTPVRGRADFAQPGIFRWIVESPQPAEFYYNSRDLLQYLPEDRSATLIPEDLGNARELRAIVQATFDLKSLLSRYEVDRAEEKSVEGRGSIALDLRPRDKNDIADVHLEFARDDLFVSQLVIRYTNGNRTEIDLTRNPDPPRDLATLSPETVFPKLPPSVHVTQFRGTGKEGR